MFNYTFKELSLSGESSLFSSFIKNSYASRVRDFFVFIYHSTTNGSKHPVYADLGVVVDRWQMAAK